MNVVWLLYKLRMIANHAPGLKPGSLWVLYAALEGPLFHGDARRLGFLRPFLSQPFFRSSGACSTFLRITDDLRCGLHFFLGWVVATSADWSVRSWPCFPGASCTGAKARFVLGWVTRPLKGRSSTVMRGLWDFFGRVFLRTCSFAPPELVRPFHLLTHGLRRGLPSFAALRLGRCYISGLGCPLLAMFSGCIMHRG